MIVLPGITDHVGRRPLKLLRGDMQLSEQQREFILPTTLLISVGALIILLALLSGVTGWLKPFIAPRVYLIEYMADLVRGPK